MKKSISAACALWCTRLLAVLMLFLTAKLHVLLDWYLDLRPMGEHGAKAIMIGFYCCVPIVLLALWHLDKLLRNILAARVFVRTNVRCISMVRWCCLAICLICIPVACFYPPIIFVVAIMAFLALVVSVLTAVMDAAVEIREENDLTI